MSIKDYQIPYSTLLTQEQDINFAGDAVYAQTMNAPTDITLDFYLNHSKIMEKTIKPNYELNIDTGLCFDEVIVKLNDNETSFTPLSSISLSGLSGTIYQILATDSYIYVMTSTNFYQLNLDGSIYNSFAYSSLPLSPTPSVVTTANGKYFDIYNNQIFLALLHTDTYIYKFDLNLNLLNYVNTTIAGNIFGLHFYNNKLYLAGNATGYIYVYNLNIELQTSFQVISTNYTFSIVFNNNIALALDNNTAMIYQYSLDTYSLIASLNIPHIYNYIKILYSNTLGSLFLIYGINNLTIFESINLITGKNIQKNNLSINIADSSGAGFNAFEKLGYLVFYNDTGLYIYNSNLKLIYSNLFTNFNIMSLSYNSSNIYFISNTSTLNVLNYAVKEPVNNPVYPADFNLILSCK